MDTRTPNPSNLIDTMGLVIEAPGFTPETFEAALQRAQARGTFHMTPIRGAVQVQSGSSPAVYTVTRTSCTCRGHMGHGYCCHRAAAIFVSDFFGLDREEILGFDLEGFPVTRAERRMQLQEVA